MQDRLQAKATIVAKTPTWGEWGRSTLILSSLLGRAAKVQPDWIRFRLQRRGRDWTITGCYKAFQRNLTETRKVSLESSSQSAVLAASEIFRRVSTKMPSNHNSTPKGPQMVLPRPQNDQLLRKPESSRWASPCASLPNQTAPSHGQQGSLTVWERCQ